MSRECHFERQTCFVNHQSKWLFFFSSISRQMHFLHKFWKMNNWNMSYQSTF